MAGSIRRQGKNSWGIQIELGRDPATKKRRFHRFTVRGTKKDAQRELTAALAQRDQGANLAPAKVSLADFLRRWLRDAVENKVALSTAVGYRSIAESQIIPALGSIRLAELRPLHVQAAYTDWLKPGNRRDGHKGALSPRTVLHYHSVLNAALDQAVKWQLLQRNPCAAVDPPRPIRTEMQCLGEAEARRFLAAAECEPLQVLFRTALTTGARIGELLALRWQDIDFSENRLVIVRNVRRISGQGYVFGKPKTHRSRRSIALDAGTAQGLQEHRRRQLEGRLLVGPAYTDQDLVFATPVGDVLADSTVRTAFNRILQRAELPRIRIHDLRHTAATLMLKAGVQPKVVSDRLGHSTVAFTLDNYAHALPDMQRDGAEALARMIGS